MVDPGPGIGTMLRLSRTFAAPREKVFQAWTQPEHLSNWWGLGPGYTAPIVEIDLRVGGRYRLGMKAPDSDEINVVGGVFREVRPPEKLVYTWSWESGSMSEENRQETLVTVEFHERGESSTELVLTHEFFPDEETCRQHIGGWTMMLDNRFGPSLEA